MKHHLLLAGGSGFTGQVLTGYFAERGWEVVVLSRDNKAAFAGARFVQWDGETFGDWTSELKGAFAVVNLAGRSVDCRYTTANRRLIMDSRVKSTRVLGEAIARCAQPPRVWLNSSSATIYHHTFGPAWDESGTDFTPTPAVKDEFSLEVIHAWERAFNAEYGVRSAESGQKPLTPSFSPSDGERVSAGQERGSRGDLTRKVALRTTMVLGHGRNSVFPVLRRLTRLGLGGQMGSGRQYVSWIHQEDYCRAIEWLIQHDDLSGAVNLAAPNPLPNAEMMRAFRELCGVPFGMPATEWMLELGAIFLRTETELILKSRRVVPGKLLASGFQFQFSEMRAALSDLTQTGLSSAKPHINK